MSMDLHTWLDKLEQRGQAKALAERLGVSAGAVSLWRDNGVPMAHWPEVVKFTRGAVKLPAMLEHAIACRQKAKTRTAA